MPNIALMGNVSPYGVMVNGTPQEVEEWARECIRKTNKKNLILSAGGGVSPGTPAEAIDALVKVANESL
jgi:uroporphyrinogen decarboxylase